MASSALNSTSPETFMITTYNMFGKNQGASFLSHICSNIAPDVIYLQEHWQTPANLSSILNFSPNYHGYGVSAMEMAVQQSILRGRPYGGTATLIHSRWRSLTKVIATSERFVIITIGNIALINVYMPTSTSNDSSVVLDLVLNEISGYLESMPNFMPIFGGDLNVNLHKSSLNSDMINDFMVKHSIVLCDTELIKNINPIDDIFTYYNRALDRKSYIDFILVSGTVRPAVYNYKIMDFALNLSDHLAVCACFDWNLVQNNTMLLKNDESASGSLFRAGLGGARDKIMRLRWDHADIDEFRRLTFNSLSPILQDMDNCADFIMHNDSAIEFKKYYIDMWYDALVSTLYNVANNIIPSLKKNALKFWWSDHANTFKQSAIDSHRIWVEANRPKSGPLFDNMKDNRYKYKFFIKNQKISACNNITDSLSDCLEYKNKTQFWQTWKAKFGSQHKGPACKIDDCETPVDAANKFAQVFAAACTPNSVEEFTKAQTTFITHKSNLLFSESPCYNSCSLLLVSDIIKKLGKNKASSIDGLTAEHIENSHPVAIIIITKLINLMIAVEYVPAAFGKSVTIPVPKDTSGLTQRLSSNYRGVTISPIFSKIFEHCLLVKFDKYLWSDESQFGFKKKMGTNHAIYSLCKTINYFTDNDSNVNLCSIDLSKAFDKVNRFVLYDKLIKRKCPIQFINILESWLCKTNTVVKWQDCLSELMPLLCGLRQGSVLSPILFSVYINDLLVKIRNSNLGCHIKHIALNVFMYADDLLLLSISMHDMQLLINICMHELSILDMKINVRKSAIMRVGKRYKETVVAPYAGNHSLNFCSEIRYLGVYLVAGCILRCNFHKSKAKYFGALNSLLGKLGSSPSENLVLSLVDTNCSPILTYGLEACNISRAQLSNLSFVHNSVFVRTFKTFDKHVIDMCHGFLYGLSDISAYL